jgi:Rod binding domain-containing protein
MAAPLVPFAISIAGGIAGKLAGNIAGKIGAGAASTASGAASSLAARPGANGLDPATDARLKKTAGDFESMFLEQMVDRMFGTLGEEGPLGSGGTGGDVWRSMLAKEHAQSLTRAGGIGLAPSVYGELVRLQAAASQPAIAAAATAGAS